MPSPARVAFTAPEYQADGTIRLTAYAFAGAARDGWEVRREGVSHLRLGRGYRLLRVSHCGVCSTDLARRHLPFPLPQVTGHEVVALDERNQPVVIEINASHAARGLRRGSWCAFCRNGLDTHCPDRLVLGIHDLPGGFSPWLLAPAANVIPVPATINPATATLIEPFAAALQAVRALPLQDADRVAVLGPRRLGSLVIAALAAWRARSRQRFEILAIARRPELRALARRLGADDAIDARAAAATSNIADVVIDTTGNPKGLDLAIQLARKEVHIKSTTGRTTLGLKHLTELVVDEMSIAPYCEAERVRSILPSPPLRTAIVIGTLPDGIAHDLKARGVDVRTAADTAELAQLVAEDGEWPLGGADLAVVGSSAEIDAVVRPQDGIERGAVRARGAILIVDGGLPRDGLLRAVLDKGLRLSTSRCGSFRSAIDLLADAACLGEQMVTDRFPATNLAGAFDRAASPRSVKVVVTHPWSLL
jgi:threonine dehydrogenase-like Zn-dependent dehydrogenase